MPIDAQTFRAVMGAFPTGVIVVATLAPDGTPRGLTTQSFLSVSTEPPLLLVSLDKSSRTLPAILAANAFAVSFLAAGRDELARRFASKHEDKFSGVSWVPAPAAKGAPVLEDDCIAYAACLVERTIDAGDHILIIGSVEAGAVRPGAPLMYYRRAYTAWPEEALTER